MKFILPFYLIIAVSTSLFGLDARAFTDADSKTIHIIGEVHTNPEHVEVRRYLNDLSMEHKVITLNEGIGFSGNYLHASNKGIEHMDTCRYDLVMTEYFKFGYIVLFNRLIRGVRRSGDVETAEYLESTLTTSLCSGVSFKFNQLIVYLRSNRNDLVTQLAKKYPVIIGELTKINEVYSNSKSGDYWAYLDGITRGHSISSPFYLRLDKSKKNWLHFFRDVVKFSKLDTSRIPHEVLSEIDGYNTRMKVYLRNIKSISMGDLNDLAQDVSGVFDALKIIRMEVRDDIFVENIISIYEENKHRDLPFYVIVGAAHTPALARELTARGYKISLNAEAKREVREKFEL